MKSVIAILCAFIFTACASKKKGFNRDALQTQLGAAAKPVFDDAKIKEAYTKRTNLPKPFKLAVYFKGMQDRSQTNWRWTEQDKATFDQIAAKLKSQGLVSDAFPLLNTVAGDEDLKSLRLAAAKHGADALLVISGATQFDRYLNGWGATYALLLPALFVKGSEVDTLFVANAVLWDVKNEFLYLTSEAEATTNTTYPAAFGKRDVELVNEAKTKALEKLKDQVAAAIEGKRT